MRFNQYKERQNVEDVSSSGCRRFDRGFNNDGVKFFCSAEQTGNQNTVSAADNSEIGMLKQRLDAQERIINNLLRQSDPFLQLPAARQIFGCRFLICEWISAVFRFR